jgi:hypothetical protein
VRGALRKFPTGVCKMKNESLSLPERIQAFTRELALSLRRITGRVVELDLPPVVQPAKSQEEPVPDADAQDE